MRAITEIVLAHSAISFEWSGSAFNNRDLTPEMSSFQESGYKVLVTLMWAEAVTDNLAQVMLDKGMTDGFALLTPACQQSFGFRGSDVNGLPLLGILSSQTNIPSSEALTDHYADVAAKCANGGAVRIKTETDRQRQIDRDR